MDLSSVCKIWYEGKGRGRKGREHEQVLYIHHKLHPKTETSCSSFLSFLLFLLFFSFFPFETIAMVTVEAPV